MSSGNIETNKIFAALLTASLIAMMTGFVAKKLVHPEKLKEDAVAMDGGPVENTDGPAKPQLPEPILDLIATADIAKGQKISKACAACHSFDQGGPQKVGPNLYGVVGQQIASVGGFSYSDALKEKGKPWTYDELNAFLWKPKVYAPGTKMNYLGLKKPDDRAAMIAWLRTLGSTGVALPSQGDIDAEKARLLPEPVIEEVVEAVESAVVETVEETAEAVNTATENADETIDGATGNAAEIVTDVIDDSAESVHAH